MNNENTPPGGNSEEQHGHSTAGRWMIVGTWVLLLSLLTLFGQRWLDKKDFPNQRPLTRIEGDRKFVELLRNRSGHYVTQGQINGLDAVFMLDTGATGVSVPAQVAEQLDLKTLYEQSVNTANGSITVQSVIFDSVAIGGLEQQRVRGHINPHMDGNQVLLGMSYLSHFDLLQRGGILTLSEPSVD